MRTLFSLFGRRADYEPEHLRSSPRRHPGNPGICHEQAGASAAAFRSCYRYPQVMLSVEPLRHKAEITMRLRGKDIHCEAVDENLYAAIDLLVDKIDRQVIKHKDKVQSHSAESAKRQAAALAAQQP
ncbi:sigma(54) modulation protein [Bordetella pertussis]|nr:ribosomal subunit interface-like protein [Bordetella pertussis B200]CFP57653.1 sigma(54) modulation protein [Bordetella pertussis]